MRAGMKRQILNKIIKTQNFAVLDSSGVYFSYEMAWRWEWMLFGE